MAYRALKTFSGLVSMKKGEEREISDDTIVKDLLRAGYIEDLSAKAKAAKSSKSAKKGGEGNV